ncbi:MAG: carbohydrate-binding domain-containing protein, partial [Bacteroidaceae bacterium]|nr:carbohydrate-binding domain-containing protein [Bacteroidaceae bacterium]
FSGKGVLNVVATGDGCRGIKSKKDITVNDLTLNVTTSGNNLGEKAFGPPAGFTGGPQGMPPFQQGERPEFNGERPAFPGNFPPFPGGKPDFGGKHKYVAPTKGIASKRMITVNSGNITVRTSTAGAEGIEAKKGMVFNGGNVYVLAKDDAINADSCILFNGANVTAISTGNDAVDSNPKTGAFSPFGSNEQSNEPAIVIRGGTVYAWSQVGSPEEGLDCDFAALVIEGGKVFSVGGGMGEMPSVPTSQTAVQPTVLLSGIGIVKDEPVLIYDADDKLLDSITVPFSLRRSFSILSCPCFKPGNTYTVKTKDYRKSFTFKENFTKVLL